MEFSVAVLASQAFTTALSVVNCLWGRVGQTESGDPMQQIESLAEAGDPLAPVQGVRELPESQLGDRASRQRWFRTGPRADGPSMWARKAKRDT
jgi:hypothetical protein